MAYLDVNNICVSYGRNQALNNISMKAEKGQIVTVIGANGAGKSTLINAISGVLRYSGKISFDGKPLPYPAYKAACSGVIQIPEGRKIFPNISVAENLILGGYALRDKSQFESRLQAVYELFPVLKDRKEQAGGSLSGGEQQMLAISRGLMSNPSLLLLDEPSLGLAPLVIRDVFNLIKTVNAQGVTVILVEQNAKQALELADWAYVLENGVFVAEGSGEDLLADDVVRRAYLGVRDAT
jgi:branched-chain amino acid transport system ATP-binding protein